MKEPQLAIDRIRKSINTADALNMRSSAVLVADLHVLLDIVDSVHLDAGTARDDSYVVSESAVREE
ncbi:hypothetical protein AWB81_07030 [Caballeronia arationis]|jgi:hypothetical protein|uniref:Uncharacterized protein n=1 Tax=Caballeronia arationis TaxID=1777142 RepID=A0A7Z7IDD4_9BURK|nr:hypothetical protein [Caballeronia arationis]SAL05125.1 hypothetical protein AWB81_07030 [Caballeronia arationis]SOE88680.1 hypothetical protein SAMN05446927_7301 [Caballeronia arationis]